MVFVEIPCSVAALPILTPSSLILFSTCSFISFGMTLIVPINPRYTLCVHLLTSCLFILSVSENICLVYWIPAQISNLALQYCRYSRHSNDCMVNLSFYFYQKE